MNLLNIFNKAKREREDRIQVLTRITRDFVEGVKNVTNDIANKQRTKQISGDIQAAIACEFILFMDHLSLLQKFEDYDKLTASALKEAQKLWLVRDATIKIILEVFLPDKSPEERQRIWFDIWMEKSLKRMKYYQQFQIWLPEFGISFEGTLAWEFSKIIANMIDANPDARFIRAIRSSCIHYAKQFGITLLKDQGEEIKSDFITVKDIYPPELANSALDFVKHIESITQDLNEHNYAIQLSNESKSNIAYEYISFIFHLHSIHRLQKYYDNHQTTFIELIQSKPDLIHPMLKTMAISCESIMPRDKLDKKQQLAKLNDICLSRSQFYWGCDKIFSDDTEGSNGSIFNGFMEKIALLLNLDTVQEIPDSVYDTVKQDIVKYGLFFIPYNWKELYG